MSQQWPGTPVGGQAAPSIPAPQAPRAPAPPPFIPGAVTPRQQADEARKQAAEQRAQQDQALQMQKFSLDLTKEDRTAKKDAAGTVDEKKVATLTTRLAGAFSDINSVRKVDPSAQEPGVFESMRGGLSPSGMTGIVARKVAGPNRRMVYDAEMDALDALLTLGTGAAYTKEQLEGQRASYFPQYGDSKEEVAAKNQRLQRLIESAKANAGPAWANVEPQIAQFMGGIMAADGSAPPPTDSAGGNPPENPFTGLPGKQQAEPDSIGEDPRFAGKRYNINGQEDPQGDFNAYGQYRDFAASQASPDGALQGTVTDWEGQPQESVENWTNWIDGQGRTRGPDGSVLSGWLGPGTNGSYEGALQQELKRQGRDDPESVENYAVRGATGASFSLFDELTGALAAAKAGVQGDDAALSYKLTRDLERARQQQNEKGQGWAGTGAEIAGSLLTGGLLGRANSLRGATTTGMKGGALYGYGSGQGLDNSLQRASIGGVTGAGLGYGLSKTGSKVGQGLNALSETSAGKAFTKLFSRAPGETDEIDNIANALDPAELVAAGKANKTRVMTSDAFPPTTTAGKTAREIGENIPWIGTAGERSAQQAERSAAVSRFAKEFEAEGGTVEGVAKSWMKTRSKQIETYTKAKNDVIDGINTPVPPVALRTTLRTIDTKIAEMQRANADAFGPVISKLSSFRDALSSGLTLRQVETNRRLLGDMFEDAGLAAVKGDGQKALNAIYKPLREDMGAFIKANGKPGDFNKWAGANKKLSGMMGDLKDSKFKSTLNNVSTTPEDAAKLLFSRTPSDVQRLVKALSPKGQDKARSAVVGEALKKATDDVTGEVSPDKFLTAINALKPSTEELFKGPHGERLGGLVKLLAGTRRAGQANATIPTGQQAARLGIAVSSVTNPKFAIPAGIIARSYESQLVRNLLVKLNKTQPGSAAEEQTRTRLMDIMARMAPQGAMRAANDTMGDVMAQSPGRAAAEDEGN